MNTPLLYGRAALSRRVGAFIIDYFVFMLLGFSPLIFLHRFWDMSSSDFSIMMGITVCCVLLKDVFGRSLGKLIFGVRIAHGDAPNRRVTVWQRIFRNVPLLLWPAELIMTFQDPYNRRLGDKWAHTLIAAEPRQKKLPIVPLAVAGGAVFMLLMVFGVTNIIRNDDSYKTATAFIQSQEEIISAVGGIEGFGFFPSGRVQTINDKGTANLYLTVIGEDATLTVRVHLTKQPGKAWVVKDFDY